MGNELAERLIEAGDFRKASEILTPNATDPADRVLAAWALLESGETAAALASASELLKQQLNPTIYARCLAVLGRAHARLGRTSEGLSSLKKSVGIAASHNKYVEADLRAQHAAAALNWVGVEPALAELPALRRAALESANRVALAEYHIVYARIAALRGWWRKAFAEASVARELVSLSPHSATQWRLEQCLASIAIMTGNLDVAIQHGERGLRLSEVVASKSKRASTVANLAYIWAVAGQFERAKALLVEAHELLERDSQIRFATCSTGIELGIRSGDDAFAKQMLELGEALTSVFTDATYYLLWFALHRVSWLIHTGEYGAAAVAAEAALKPVTWAADEQLSARMKLLHAEALSLSGSQVDALNVFSDVASRATRSTLEVVAEFERVGALLRRKTDRTGSLLSLQAAWRLMSGAGLLGPMKGVEQTTKQLGFPLERVKAGMRHDLDAPEVTAHIARILRLGRYPRLQAQEILALLQASDACSGAGLYEISDGQRTELARFGRWSSERATAAIAQRIWIGEGASPSLEIEAYPRSIETFTFLRLSLEQLAGSAFAATRAEFDAEPPALWPFETASQQDGMIVGSDAMAVLLGTTKRIAPSTITVLLTGETGTGKELLARALHDASPRSSKPFIPFNCSAVSREMLDAQLFGYRKGAFTGATDAFHGVIRAAAGGTLFLDEIGEVALDVQPKLLRFLESGEIHPLGEPRPLHVDVRVVAATNADLETLVEAGQFREDLFYRLNVVRLQVPPLRERREEIPALVQHYLDKCSREFQKTGLRLSDETMEYLILYKWPGNVRQLANEVRRMVALAESGAVLMPEHLSQPIASSRRTIPTAERSLAPTEFVVRVDQPMAAALEHVERSMIRYALRLTGGKLEDAALRLGLSRKGLYLKRQRLGLCDADEAQPVAAPLDPTQQTPSLGT
jgi:DNA-binding NtrC family response regulator/tetratricopeptide (TPR) repeat protein